MTQSKLHKCRPRPSFPIFCYLIETHLQTGRSKKQVSGCCIIDPRFVVLLPMSPYRNNPFQVFSSIIILGVFLWLCFGTSFLSVEKQNPVTINNSLPADADDSEKTSNPFENATEENAETNPTTFSEDYLGEDTEHCLETDIPLKHDKSSFERIGPAFYSESVAQPPEKNSFQDHY